MSGTGDLARGKHVGVGSAITNAAMGGGLGALKSALTPGGAFAPSSAGMNFTSGDVMKGAGMMARDAAVHGVKAAGSAIAHNPMVAAQAAGGILDARESNARTQMMQQQIDLQRQQHDEQEQRRKQLQSLLQPLLASYKPGGF